MKNRPAMIALLAALLVGGAWTWLRLEHHADRAVLGAVEALAFTLWYTIWRAGRVGSGR